MHHIYDEVMGLLVRMTHLLRRFRDHEQNPQVSKYRLLDEDLQNAQLLGNAAVKEFYP